MKELVEKRNDLVDQMSKIVDTAKAENRAVTEAEAEQFENCKAEIQNIDKTLKMGEEMEQFENKTVVEPVKELTNKERDEKAFINLIKQVKNADTPMTYGENGAVIPTSIAKRIIERVEATCPIWTMAEHFNIKGNLSLPKEDEDGTNIEMTYADEFSDAESGKAKLVSVNLGEFLGRSLVKVSNSLINNSEFDIVTYVVNKIAKKVSKFLERELLVGTENKIEGLRGVTLTVETETAGKIGSDDLIDLQEEVEDDYQADAIFIMNKATRKAIRKLKDGQGNYLLERDYTSKWNYVLLGKPVYTTSVDLGGAVFYGDMSGLAVKISENINIQILKEKYAEQHATGVLAFVGCDAKVQDTQKIAKLTIKA